MQWDYRQGGDIYSETVNTLIGRGITKDTDFDRSQTFVMPGVLADGTPNDIQITATNAYFNNFGSQAPAEVNVIDGTTYPTEGDFFDLFTATDSGWPNLHLEVVDISIVGTESLVQCHQLPRSM